VDTGLVGAVETDLDGVVPGNRGCNLHNHVNLDRREEVDILG